MEELELKDIIGKTIESYEWGTAESNYGDEPKITLKFTDGTQFSFVLARDDDE